MKTTNISPNNLPEPYRARFQDNFSREDFQALLVAELKDSPVCRAFLDGYDERSHETFLKNYAETKASVILDLEALREESEFGDSIFKSLAEDRLWDIQQKKLFDLQCLWRAEKVRIPGIESTQDFLYWEHDIRLCTFLPPITPDELELYIAYLNNSTEEQTLFYPCEWQNYDEFKDEDLDAEMPEWYRFHNKQTGNGALLLLPDVRGDKEEFYRMCWFNAQYPTLHEETRANMLRKPLLFAGDTDALFQLMTQLESKRFLKQYERYAGMRKAKHAHDAVGDAVQFLISLNHPVPIEAHTDWRRAVVEAKNRYENRSVAEVMPLVYEEYLLRADLGIAHQPEKDQRQFDIVKCMKAPVLQGRKLCGEPEDFNF